DRFHAVFFRVETHGEFRQGQGRGWFFVTPKFTARPAATITAGSGTTTTTRRTRPTGTIATRCAAAAETACARTGTRPAGATLSAAAEIAAFTAHAAIFAGMVGEFVEVGGSGLRPLRDEQLFEIEFVFE
ncbi:MAG: hypothetical protein RL380_134, partial [Verrucomicrobiota bacterium]